MAASPGRRDAAQACGPAERCGDGGAMAWHGCVVLRSLLGAAGAEAGARSPPRGGPTPHLRLCAAPILLKGARNGRKRRFLVAWRVRSGASSRLPAQAQEKCLLSELIDSRLVGFRGVSAPLGTKKRHFLPFRRGFAARSPATRACIGSRSGASRATPRSLPASPCAPIPKEGAPCQWWLSRGARALPSCRSEGAARPKADGPLVPKRGP